MVPTLSRPHFFLGGGELDRSHWRTAVMPRHGHKRATVSLLSTCLGFSPREEHPWELAWPYSCCVASAEVHLLTRSQSIEAKPSVSALTGKGTHGRFWIPSWKPVGAWWAHLSPLVSRRLPQLHGSGRGVAKASTAPPPLDLAHSHCSRGQAPSFWACFCICNMGG